MSEITWKKKSLSDKFAMNVIIYILILKEHNHVKNHDEIN